MTTDRIRQTSDHILVISPHGFCSNAETREDNDFMANQPIPEETQKACSEHELLVSKLRASGVNVIVHESHDRTAPDACFPNNWFGTLSSEDTRCIVTFPMLKPSRRRERNPQLVQRLQHEYHYNQVVDLSDLESRSTPIIVEGTGALVLDRIRKVAYAALSQRCDLAAAQYFADSFGYQLHSFHTLHKGHAVYHTNVVMSIGRTFAVLCADVIASDEERAATLRALRQHHEVVLITLEQMAQFCGNVLELRTTRGGSVLAMSSAAYEGFTAEQREVLLKHVDSLVHSDIATIETVGGGSVRCLIAELF
eukprot:TRINITY_DN6021_c0_g1_i2.p1 TRINITY_DN6021_c0_g1~~TRINITY_DN6021_c0_g1_i2.p1  ORF type:complete len:309 (-),score=43.99 TRINITY_DN6021_c0_g1_i2:194-1120(-)